MLTRLAQYFSGKRVETNVEDEFEEQRRELARIRGEIASVRLHLREGQAAVDALRCREENFQSDIESLLMEIHDPMLVRDMDAQVVEGSRDERWEERLFELKNPVATLARITHPRQQVGGDDGDDVSSEDDERRNRKPIRPRREKRLDFVALDEHSDVDDANHSEPESEASVDQGTIAIDVSAKGAVDDDGGQIPTPMPNAVHLQELGEDDFSTSTEYRRWRTRLARMQQEDLVRSYFSGKVLKELRSKREVVEGKLFERHCDLIHLQEFEKNAERQLVANDVAMHGGRRPEQMREPDVAVERAPQLTMVEHNGSTNGLPVN